MTLDNLSLYKADNINVTNRVVSYCTIYQLSELFFTGKLVPSTVSLDLYFVLVLQDYKMLSHKCR